MALAPRRTAPNLDGSTALTMTQIAEGVAGVDIPTAACPVYIDSAGLIQLSDGTSANAAAKVRGFSARAASAGQPVTIMGPGTRFGYADAGGLTPGADLFVAATAGRLDTGATTGGTLACAFAINDTDIMVMRFL